MWEGRHGMSYEKTGILRLEGVGGSWYVVEEKTGGLPGG